MEIAIDAMESGAKASRHLARMAGLEAGLEAGLGWQASRQASMEIGTDAMESGAKQTLG